MGQPMGDMYSSSVWVSRGGAWVAVFHTETPVPPPAPQKQGDQDRRHTHLSRAYSVLARFRIGMSGSAPFQRARNSWYSAALLAVSPESA